MKARPGWPTVAAITSITHERNEIWADRADPAELARALALEGPVDVRETHLSTVLLAGDLAIKLIKPLDLPFVRAAALMRRRALCESEVRLNRPFAPRIYRGVRAVIRRAHGLALAPIDTAGAIDYAVVMTRFDERTTLAARVEAGTATSEDVARAARRLAAVHREAASAPGRDERAALRDRVGHTFTDLLASESLDRRCVRSLERGLGAFLDGRQAQLERRSAEGSVRMGHGDLRAEHVVLADDGDVAFVDCLAFDEHLRGGDVAADLAFLAMDLEALGASELVPGLVAAYREAGGDPGDDALLAFHVAERALVRAKVELARRGQLPAADPVRDALAVQAGRHLAQAERALWRARGPLVLVVCGTAATGKSTIAGALAALSGLPMLSSDVTRKRLFGLAPVQRAEPIAYADEWNLRTYHALGSATAVEVAEHGGAIVDGTFRHRADRDAFAVSLRGALARCVFVECRAPAAVVAERARLRLLDRERVSDAGTEVAGRQLAELEPLDEVGPELHLAVRSDRPTPEVLDDVLALLDTRLARGAAGEGTTDPPGESRAVSS